MIDGRMETFLQLCETMNFTKTAEKLNMTQPAVTQQIHYLENLYGCKLFEYKGRILSKTVKGELLEQLAKTLRYNNKVVTEKMMAKEQELPLLKLGATRSIGEYVIGDLVSEFLTDCKRNLTLSVDNTKTLLNQLDQGKIDLALVEGNFNRNYYDYQLYQVEPFVGICACNHPFAGKEIGFRELFTQTIFVRESGSGTREILINILKDQGMDLNHFSRVTEINNFTLIKQLVEKEIGISFVYQSVVKKEVEQGKISCFSICGMDIIHEFNYVYLKNSMQAKEIITCLSKGVKEKQTIKV